MRPLSSFRNAIQFVAVGLSLYRAHALFPVDYEVTNNCIACAQSGSIFNFDLNACVSATCDLSQRCCSTVECCVTDGCRAPMDLFAYDGYGEFTARCDTCCDDLQNPEFDKIQDFLHELITDDCSTAYNTSEGSGACVMTLAFTDENKGYATFTVDDSQISKNGALYPAINVSSVQTFPDMPSFNATWLAEPLVFYNSSYDATACPTALNFFAKQRYELESVLGGNATYSFVRSGPNYCSYFAKSLIYKYATQWFDLEDISADTLGKPQISDLSMIPITWERDYPKICQYRWWLNDGVVEEPWYSAFKQEKCVHTYQYPPSCAKCAQCTTHDEELLLNLTQTATATTSEIQVLQKRCPHLASSINVSGRKRELQTSPRRPSSGLRSFSSGLRALKLPGQ